jgi:hypothetical protein
MNQNSIRTVFLNVQRSILQAKTLKGESVELDRPTRRKFVFPALAHALNEYQENVSAPSPSYGNFSAMLTNCQGHTFSATDRNLLGGAENKSL